MLSNFSQYSPFSQWSPFGMQSPGGYGPSAASSPGINPYMQYQAGNPFFTQPGAYGHAYTTALQTIPMLGQLAQHIQLQGGVTQQIGIALNHLAQHLVVLSQQVMLGHQAHGATGLGLGAGQGSGLGGQPFGGGQAGWQNGPFAAVQPFAGSQPFGFAPFPGATGLGGQAPAWGAQRPQTIQ